MSRSPFILEGQTFDLGHLAPGKLLCPRLQEKAPPLTIDVTFGHHAYTVSAPAGSAGSNQVVERGDPRVFDVVRWQLSRDYLPALVESLPNSHVEFTPEVRNYRFAMATRLPGGMEYAMFFSLKRSSAPGCDLHMTIESAYPIQPGSRPKPPGRIRFGVLATKVALGEKVSRPPVR